MKRNHRKPRWPTTLTVPTQRASLPEVEHRLGFAADESGPKYTNHDRSSPTSPLDRFVFSSAYLRARWVDLNLAAKTPWVYAGTSASVSKSSEESDSQNLVYVVGQYNYSYRKISMKGYLTELKFHPDFQQAIMNALAIENDAERSQEFDKVLR
ncbi:hypothetical protein FS837_009446 [Tulasnella sp. UAMH 9824]|nr:hypothetical protein FS837_009446 [Tulasnella sp. UAMH 9824]